jgi:hypothetical protein
LRAGINQSHVEMIGPDGVGSGQIEMMCENPIIDTQGIAFKHADMAVEI